MAEQAQQGSGGELVRGVGLWQAVALNVTTVVGAGVFATIPPMLKHLPGPYALLPWLAAGLLILLDGMIWSELGAALPGSGGTYQYLLRSYGESRWGRLMAFLFIWQFLLSGPLELGSGLVALAQFAPSLSPGFETFNKRFRVEWEWVNWTDPSTGDEIKLGMTFDPAHLLAFLIGLFIVYLLYRNIKTLGRLTVAIWAGVLLTIAWILVEGFVRFNPGRAFDFSGAAARAPDRFAGRLGVTMALALYSYLGYYNVCYLGDEVRNPGRTIPRAILLSTLLIVVLFVGVHLALLGTVPWERVADSAGDPQYSLAADFMREIHGGWAATLVTVLLIWCIIGSAFGGLLGYSRIPYGAARAGHFFAVFARVHPTQRIPHVALLLVGGLMLFWTFFELETVIKALIVTRILEQFVAQIVGLMLLRRNRPDLYRPYKVVLYPLPCLLALAGWLYVYFSSGWLYIGLGLATLATGVVAFLVWSRGRGGWPFTKKPLAA